MGQFTDLFPMSIFRERLTIDDDQRRELSDQIVSMRSRPANEDESAWTGDVDGHEFLHADPAFAELFTKISEAVIGYVDGLGVDSDMLEFWFQRSWATISNHGQRIFEHAHVQSHLSVAYYLQKPVDGGGIYFSVASHPNEFVEGLFTISKATAGLIRTPGDRTLNRVYVEPQQDEVLVFPSRTLHSTAPNLSQTPRISISADIIVTLKQSHGHETMMPPVSGWQKFA